MAGKQTPDNFSIMKSLFPSIPANWDSRISLASKSLWDTTKTVITADGMNSLRNEIFNELLNRIALVKFHKFEFNNPLGRFKRGYITAGEVIQEIATDVIQGREFTEDGDEPDQFKKFKPDVKAAYHRINRQMVYPITVDDDRMKRAFINEFGLAHMIGDIVSTMSNSNELDEFIYCKQLFESTYSSSEFPIQTTQIIEVPDIRTDKTKVPDFLEVFKKQLRLMSFPSRKFSASNMMLATRPNEMNLFLDVEFTVINDVYNLASAFSPEYMDLKIPIIGLDNLSEKLDDENIIGCAAHTNSLYVYDTKRELAMAQNARGLYTNYFYHVHQEYVASPFKQMVFFKAV